MIPTRLSRPFGRPSPQIRWNDTVKSLKLLIRDQVDGRVEVGYATRVRGCAGTFSYSFIDGSPCNQGDGLYLAQRSNGQTIPLNWDFGPHASSIISASSGSLSSACGTRYVFVDGVTHGVWSYGSGVYLGQYEDLVCSGDWWVSALNSPPDASWDAALEFYWPWIAPNGDADPSHRYFTSTDGIEAMGGLFSRAAASAPPSFPGIGVGVYVTAPANPFPSYPSPSSPGVFNADDLIGYSPWDAVQLSNLILYAGNGGYNFQLELPIGYPPSGSSLFVQTDITAIDLGAISVPAGYYPESIYSFCADPTLGLFWGHQVGIRTITQYGYRSGPTDVPVATDAGAGLTGIDYRVYRVTWVTADGETAGGPPSIVWQPTSSPTAKVSVTAQVGPAGTTARNLYRAFPYNVSGDYWRAPTSLDYKLVGTVANNTDVAIEDNTAPGAEGVTLPSAITTPQTRLLVGGPWGSTSYIDRIELI